MITWHEVFIVAALVAAVAVVGAVVGTLALRRVRHRSVSASIVVVALTAAAVNIAGIALVGADMVVSGHALVVLMVVVIAATIAALAVATVLAKTLSSGTRALGLAARNVGGEALLPGVTDPATAEQAELATELARAHDRLAAARVRERDLEASRRELVAWVSHDLRTPLAGIRAMAEALEDDVVTDAATVHRYHGRMRLEADRMSQMVDDLFELSRIHAGTLRLTRQPVALTDLISDTLASTDPIARAKGVHLHGHATASPQVSVDVASNDSRFPKSRRQRDPTHTG